MQVVVGVIAIAIAFSWLERRFPVRRQKLFRAGWVTNVCHWFFNQTIVNVGVIIGAIPLIFCWAGQLTPAFK